MVISARCSVRVRALDRAVHRGDARVEQLGHLGRLPLQHVTEHQHGPLPSGQVLQRGDERQADRLTRLHDLGGIACGQDPVVGDRQDPGGLRKRLAEVLDRRRLRRPQVHRAGPPFLARQHVEADVRRDPVEPRAEARATFEALEAFPRPEQGLLHGVLGVEGRAEHPVAVRGQLPPMLGEPLLEIVGPQRGAGRIRCRTHGDQPTERGAEPGPTCLPPTATGNVGRDREVTIWLVRRRKRRARRTRWSAA